MMNPWYNTINSLPAPVPAQAPMQQSFGPMFSNPVMKMQYIMQAMRDPAGFVKQHIPDIPNEIQNDPNAILNFLRQNKGLTDADIQRATGGYLNGYR